jgi:acyl-CoA thioester hydrolase
MSDFPFSFQVQIYYEDTDHSGVVYHANYLKYFERAREHAIGKELLVRLWQEEGLGFAVYKVELGFFEGAQFGDVLEIRSRYEREGTYRVNWFQEAWRPGSKKPACQGMVQMICLDKDKQLRPMPVEALRLG